MYDETIHRWINLVGRDENFSSLTASNPIKLINRNYRRPLGGSSPVPKTERTASPTPTSRMKPGFVVSWFSRCSRLRPTYAPPSGQKRRPPGPRATCLRIGCMILRYARVGDLGLFETQDILHNDYFTKVTRVCYRTYFSFNAFAKCSSALMSLIESLPISESKTYLSVKSKSTVSVSSSFVPSGL